MKQVGKVISSDYEQALIHVISKCTCNENCEKCNKCHFGNFIVVPNSVNVKPGEFVDIESNTTKVYYKIILLYAVPLLLGILLKFLIPIEINSSLSDIIAITTGILLYIISLLLIHLVKTRKKIVYKINHR